MCSPLQARDLAWDFANHLRSLPRTLQAALDAQDQITAILGWVIPCFE
jgi:hypothetical protein